MKIRENKKQIEITKKEFNGCAMLVKREQLVEWLDELCKLERDCDSIEEVGEVLCDSDNNTALVMYIFSVLEGEEAEEAIGFILDSKLFKIVMEEQAEKMESVAKINFLEDEVISVGQWNEYCEAVNYIDYWIYDIAELPEILEFNENTIINLLRTEYKGDYCRLGVYGLETGHESDFIDYDEYADWYLSDFCNLLEYYY